METTTATPLNHHHHLLPSTSEDRRIERMGVNPKHPEYSSDDQMRMMKEHERPIYIMEESKRVMEEWNTTIVPKIIPRVHTLLQQVKDMKHRTDAKENVVHHQDQRTRETIKAELGMILEETIALERQIQTVFNQLRTCKQQIHDTLEGNPLCTKYLSAISKLPVFGRVSSTSHHNKEHKTLDHYYQHHFLHHYETATVEYQQVSDQCQHILLLVSNTRTCLKTA